MEQKTKRHKVVEIIKKHCCSNKENFSCDKDLRDNYGIDSIILVEILVEVETELNMVFDSNLLTYDNFSTADKIINYVESKA